MAKQNETTPKEKTVGQLLAESMSQEAVDKGLVYDPKVIKEVGAGESGVYTGLEKVYPSVEGDFFDPYESYIDRGTLRGGQYDIETLNKLRADNQSNWEQTGNALGRIAVNVIPQIIGGFASMVDIQGYWDAEHAANNAIVNSVDEFKKEVDSEWFPIYEENPNGFMQMGDFAWWASRGSSLVESIAAFAAQGAGAAKLASMGLKGISLGLKGQKLGRAILGAKNSQMLLKGTETLATSLMLNQSEAVLESSQVFKSTYADRLKLGYSHEEANKAAASAATATMNLNRINILLNLTSASAFLKPFQSTRTLLKNPSLLRTFGDIVKEGSQEATEELINHVASKKGIAVGKGKEYGFNEALQDIGSMEGFEAAFLGALGGIGQTGVTSILQSSKYGPGSTTDSEGNRISRKTYEKNKYEEQQSVINSLKEKGVNTTDSMKNIKDTIIFQEKLNKALKEGDQETFNSLKEEMFENQALTSFKSGTTKILEELYKQEASKPIEEVGQDHIDKVNEALKNIKVLEKIYNNYENYNNVDELFYNKANKIRVDKNLSFVENSKNLNQIDLGKAVATIAKKYSFEKEQDVLIKEEGDLKETIKKKYTIDLPFSLSNLDENQGDTEHNKAVYDEFLKEVKQLPYYTKDLEYQQKITELENTSLQLDKDFSKLTSPKYQEEVLKKQEKESKIKEAKQEIEKANSIAEIEKIKQAFDDKDLHKIADDKITDLKENQKKELAIKKQKLIVDELSNKINQAKEEDVESLRQEVNAQEISLDDKSNLLDQINKRLAVLNGKEVEEADPLSVFTHSSHPEEVQREEEIYKTNIPSDIPNNNTESKSVEEEINNVISKVNIDKSTQSIDSDGIIYNYNRPTEGNNRAAFLSREFNQKIESGILSREEITNTIDNLQVLDPDTLNEGTTIYFEVKEDYEGEKYNPKSNTKEKILWSVRESQLRDIHGDSYKQSDDYINEVPIVAKDKEGNELFYLHDSSWINEQNIEASPEEIVKDKEQLFNMRSTISKRGKVKTHITYKSFGKLFKTINGESIDVSAAMPDSKLVLAIGQDGLFKMSDNPSKVLKGGKNAIILNNEPEDGRLYALVPVGQKENIAIPLERKVLNQESIDSMINAITAYLENDPENPIVKELGSPSSLNIDILDIQGLRKYLSRFVYLVNTDKSAGLSSFLEVKTDELNSAVPLITVTATGIEFGRPGINDQLSGKGQKAVVISRNFQETSDEAKNQIAKSENLKKLAKLKTHLSKMLSNADKTTLQSKGRIALIDNEGNVKTIPYTEYLKTAFQTNIQGLNIGTEESPKWVYTIQPTILFDTSFTKEKVKRKEDKVVDKLETNSTEDKAKIIKKERIDKFTEFFTFGNSFDEITSNLFRKIIDLQTEGNLTESLRLSKVKDYVLQRLHDNFFVSSNGFIAAKNRLNDDIQEFNKLYGKVSFEEDALELANAFEISIEQLQGFLTNIESGVEIPGLTVDIVKKAIEIRNNRNTNKEDDKIEIGDLEIDLGDSDINPLGEDIEDAIPELTEEQLQQQRQETDSLIIKGINPRTQQSLISYISSKIIEKSLEAKESTGNSVINTKSVFQEVKTNFSNLSKLYKEKGFPNKAEKVNIILDQFNKVENLTQQYLSLLSTGSVNVIEDDNVEDGGLERTNYSDDWTFIVSSKNTASADLKKFFSFITARDSKGILRNELGFPEVLPFDEVYDTLHELLANKPADYDLMIQYLELYKERFPWLQSVIEKLESASEKIQNEFVSDMTKHSIDMRFVMWSKDKNGAYSLQDWSSNASSTEQRIRNFWNSNLKSINNQSNLVIVDEDGTYVFNQKEVDKILSKAKQWDSNPPSNNEEGIEEVKEWLNNFGINLTNKTFIDLANGKFINKGKLTWNDLFKNSRGLIKVLSKELEKNRANNLDDAELLKDTVIKQLARLEASNNSNVFSNSFQAGGKTIYSYGNNNFLVNRMRDLTALDDKGEFINKSLIEGLQQVSFTKDSLWLEELTSTDEIGINTKNTLKLNYLSLEALKKKFTPSQDNRKLNKLNAAEHEVAKTAFFFNNSGEVINGEKRRIVRFFYPTMSDKSTMLSIQALSKELVLDDTGNISQENLDLLYNTIVLPEINRIQAKQSENVIGYEPNYFYFLPSLNTLEIEVGSNKSNFRDFIIDKGSISPEIKEQIIKEIKSVYDNLIVKKLEDWNKLGIGITNSKDKILNSFLDKGYMSNIAKGGNNENKVKYAAMDYVFNYLIANAESFKLFAGDPALYAKFKKNKSLDENLQETFTNIGKRLAGDIAPGIELANSKSNKYYQVFIADKKLNSNNVNDFIQKEYFEKIMSDFKDNYSGIEGSDAQEYTTWKEHLYVMKQLGRLTEKQYSDFYFKLNSNKKLTYDELGTILQPIKPVYVGNVLNVEDNIDRRVYIKSSSFPLIPQLTLGFEIDKIRKALEKFEDSKSKESNNGQIPTVRASFSTANKVGSIKNTLNVFDDKGNVIDDLLIDDSNSLLLSRENFRIQQDVPYKRDKEEINIGTQERKLLFVNLLDTQIDENTTGADLQKLYEDNYKDLFEYAQEKLFNRLGLIENIEDNSISSLLIVPESNIFEEVTTAQSNISTASPIQKATLKSQLEEKIGKEEIERVNYINNNFDFIVEQLVKNAKINVFFQDENNEYKKCE